jgi:hypothetical protein
MLNISVQDLPPVYVIAVIIGHARYPFDIRGHNPRQLPRGLIYQEPLGVGGGFIQLTSHQKDIPAWRCMQPKSIMSVAENLVEATGKIVNENADQLMQQSGRPGRRERASRITPREPRLVNFDCLRWPSGWSEFTSHFLVRLHAADRCREASRIGRWAELARPGTGTTGRASRRVGSGRAAVGHDARRAVPR